MGIAPENTAVGCDLDYGETPRPACGERVARSAG
jgi:hypothetical protein